MKITSTAIVPLSSPTTKLDLTTHFEPIMNIAVRNISYNMVYEKLNKNTLVAGRGVVQATMDLFFDNLKKELNKN